MSEVVRERLEHLLTELEPVLAEPAPPERGSPDQVPPARDGEAELAAVSAGVSPVRRAANVVGVRCVEFARDHLAAVILVLAVGIGWTAYSLLATRSTPVALAVSPTAAVASPTVLAGATPKASATPTVLVHVIGAVAKPAVVSLPEGARVQDAIAAAGGLTRGADPGDLNLAAVVADGSQVRIGTRQHPGGQVRGAEAESSSAGSTTDSGSGTTKISINSATAAQLDSLPGVGPVTAQKIVQWRTEHGRFNAVTELQEVDGIGPKTYADLAEHIRL